MRVGAVEEWLAVRSVLLGSIIQIRQTCALIRAAKDTLSDDLFKDLRDQSGINSQVWSKHLQIGLNDRLHPLQDKLPPKYSTIHQTLPDQRGAQGSTGRGDLLHSTIQGVLNRWLKDYKVRGTNQELPEYFNKLARVLGSRYLVLTTSLGHPEPLQGRPKKLASVYTLKSQYEGRETITSLYSRGHKTRLRQSFNAQPALDVHLAGIRGRGEGAVPTRIPLEPSSVSDGNLHWLPLQSSRRT